MILFFFVKIDTLPPLSITDCVTRGARMPIKDVSKEEQSFLYLPGKTKRDPIQLKASDIGSRGVMENSQSFLC